MAIVFIKLTSETMFMAASEKGFSALRFVGLRSDAAGVPDFWGN